MEENINLSNIKNLVFQGGSVKGLAYVGAIGALQHYNLIDFSKLEKVCGTSAGAITALAIALDYKPDDLLNILSSDFESFIDIKKRVTKRRILNFRTHGSSTQASSASVFASQLSSRLGLCSGEEVLNWLEQQIICPQTNIPWCTFKEFHHLKVENDKLEASDTDKKYYKELSVIGYNLNRKTTVTFNYVNTPNVIISDAVRISMSIPFLFAPHEYYVKSVRDGVVERLVDLEYQNEYWIDGGITENYPLHVFDVRGQCNGATLGFCLKNFAKLNQVQLGKPKVKEIKNSWDYSVAVLKSGCYKTQQQNRFQRGNEICRTVYINRLDIGTFDFNLTADQKNKLIEAGWDSIVKKFGTNGKVEVKCNLRLPDDAPSSNPNAQCCLIM